MKNVIALIADNCSVNKSISNIREVPLLGCASHRFQLAVNEILEEYMVDVPPLSDRQSVWAPVMVEKGLRI